MNTPQAANPDQAFILVPERKVDSLERQVDSLEIALLAAVITISIVTLVVIVVLFRTRSATRKLDERLAALEDLRDRIDGNTALLNNLDSEANGLAAMMLEILTELRRDRFH